MGYRYVYQLIRAFDDKIGPDMRGIVEQYLGPDPEIHRAKFLTLTRQLNIVAEGRDGVWFHGHQIPWSKLEENVSRLFYVRVCDSSRKCQGGNGCRNQVSVVMPRNIYIVAFPYIDFQTMDAIYGIDDDEVPYEAYEPHGGWLGVALLELRCDECSEVDEDEPGEFGTDLAECDAYSLGLQGALEEIQSLHTIVRSHELAARLQALVEIERAREQAIS